MYQSSPIFFIWLFSNFIFKMAECQLSHMKTLFLKHFWRHVIIVFLSLLIYNSLSVVIWKCVHNLENLYSEIPYKFEVCCKERFSVKLVTVFSFVFLFYLFTVDM